MAKREITVGQAVDRLLKLRTDQHVAADKAVARVQKRFAAREAEYLCNLTQTVKERALAMVDAEYDVSTVVRGLQSFRSTCADIAGAMGVTKESPALPASDSDPPVQPQGEQIPDRLKEPLSPERLAVARGGKR